MINSIVDSISDFLRSNSGRNQLFLLIIPASLFLAVFFIMPLIYEIVLSFHEYQFGAFSEITFVGLQNYIEALTEAQFLTSLGNTAIFIVGTITLQFVLGFAIALLFRKESRTMNIFRSLVLIPSLLTPLVAGLVWKLLLHPDLGPFTYHIRQFGIPIGSGLYTERSTALWTIILVDVWEWTPLMFIILLSGLKSLPTELYEAARVDGASTIQKFIHITIPLMIPTITVALLIRTMDAMKIFDIVFAITRGGPGTATTVINYRIYEVGMEELHIGYASAMSNVLLIISVIIGMVFLRKLYARRSLR